MERTLLEHAERLEVDPDVLVNDLEYPVWEEITQPYGKASSARRVKTSPDPPTRSDTPFRLAEPTAPRRSTQTPSTSPSDFNGSFLPSVSGLQRYWIAAVEPSPSELGPISSTSIFGAHPSNSHMGRLGCSESLSHGVLDPTAAYTPHHSELVYRPIQMDAYPPIPLHSITCSPYDLESGQIDYNYANSLQNYVSPDPVALPSNPDPLHTLSSWLLGVDSSDPEPGIRNGPEVGSNVGERCEGCRCCEKRRVSM